MLAGQRSAAPIFGVSEMSNHMTVAVGGPPRSGKTSLIIQIMLNARNSENILVVDCSSNCDIKKFFYEWIET
jgi:Ni2+-binding GTPase involved in maturation of urease and hydrogenase